MQQAEIRKTFPMRSEYGNKILQFVKVKICLNSQFKTSIMPLKNPNFSIALNRRKNS